MLKINQEDDNIDKILRPRTLSDFVGQDDLKEKLNIAIKASKDRNEPICHILLNSSFGAGKTTIANIIANEYGKECNVVMATSIRSMADLLSILTKIEKNGILFVDECHAINIKLQEALYSALEDFKISLRVANKEVVHIKINPFCFIGATTHLGKLSEPFQSRFGIVHTLREYSDEEISLIIYANIRKFNLKLASEDCLINIARRCRGIPRYANRLLSRIRDYVHIYNNNLVDIDSINKAMYLENIDEMGLTSLDLKYLNHLYEFFAGGPAGKNAISYSINENPETVESHIEPFLCRKGFIVRNKTGRMLTSDGIKYILCEK